MNQNEHLAQPFCRRNMSREALGLIADQLNKIIASLLAQGARKITISFPEADKAEDPDDSLFHAAARGEK